MKKIIVANNRQKNTHNKDVCFNNDENSVIEFDCGPWRNTMEEAQKDEMLFKENREAFFKLLKG